MRKFKGKLPHSRRGRPEIHPYDDWFEAARNGPTVVERGVDFNGPTDCVAVNIRNAAARRNLRVSLMLTEPERKRSRVYRAWEKDVVIREVVRLPVRER